MNNYFNVSVIDRVLFFYIILKISIIALALGCIYSGIFYWLGGQGGVWYKKSWIRDWVCPLVVLAVMEWLGKWHWSLLLCYPLMALALSTYHKWLNPIFNKPKSDCYFMNWFMHGFIIGLALLPYGYFTDTIDTIILRAFILGVFMMVWSEIIDKDKVEESGRGGLIIATLKMLGG